MVILEHKFFAASLLCFLGNKYIRSSQLFYELFWISSRELISGDPLLHFGLLFVLFLRLVLELLNFSEFIICLDIVTF